MQMGMGVATSLSYEVISVDPIVGGHASNVLERRSGIVHVHEKQDRRQHTSLRQSVARRLLVGVHAVDDSPDASTVEVVRQPTE